jgi:hypothetical protein
MLTNPELSDNSAGSPRLNWFIFLVVALAPVFLTIITVQVVSRENEAAVVVASLGSGLSGIICGILLARRLGKTMRHKIALAIGFALLMGIACTAMSCFGCLASGFPVNFH